MNISVFCKITKKYRYCPECKKELMSDELELKNGILTIGCKCGWQMKFDDRGNGIRKN